MHSVAIILVHYNTPDLTLACVKSLQDLDAASLDVTIVVIDNGSSVPVYIPQSLNKFPVIQIKSSANLGFTGGNNLGIVEARSRFNPDSFWLLNTDTHVEPQTLQELVKSIETQKAGAAVSKIYFTKGHEFHADSYSEKQKGSIIWFGGGVIDWANLDSFHVCVDEVDRGQVDAFATTEFATGCSLLIPRKTIETVGLLDKRFFLYYEDTDYSLRIKKSGLSIAFVQSSKVWHDNAGSSGGSGSPLQQYYQTRNRLLLAFLHAPWRTKLTALRLAMSLLFFGSSVERKAVLHLFTARFGKQPIV